MAKSNRPDEQIQLVTFKVGGQEFGFGILEVERVLRYEAPAPLPEAPDFLEGVLPYGDTIVPIIDMRKRLAVEAPVRDETRILILDWDQGRIGIVVDAVTELLKISVDAITPPPPLVRGLAAEYINGVYSQDGRVIVMLAMTRILSSDERLALEAATAETANES